MPTMPNSLTKFNCQNPLRIIAAELRKPVADSELHEMSLIPHKRLCSSLGDGSENTNQRQQREEQHGSLQFL